MDRGTLLGFLLGLGLLAVAILAGPSARIFFHWPSLIVVFGGVIASTMIRFPLAHVSSAFAVGSRAFFTQAASPQRVVTELMSLCQRYRKEGWKGLEKAAPSDRFLAKGLQMIVDKTPKERMRDLLTAEIHATQDRHGLGQEIFRFIAGAAPSFGMVGTLIGMVQLFASLKDPAGVAQAMALSLLSTLWGAVIAYLIAMPLSGKLEYRSKEELLNKQLMMEGVLGIAIELNPSELEELLNSFLAPKEKVRRGGAERG